MQIREVAAPPAGDQNLLAKPIRVIQQRNPAPPLAGFDGAHEPRGAAANDKYIEWMDHVRVSEAYM